MEAGIFSFAIHHVFLVRNVSSSTLPFSAGKRYYFDDFERNINTKDGSVSDLDYIFADRFSPHGRWQQDLLWGDDRPSGFFDVSLHR